MNRMKHVYAIKILLKRRVIFFLPCTARTRVVLIPDDLALNPQFRWK